MRAKILKDMAGLTAGTEIELVNGYCATDGYYYTCELPNGDRVTIHSGLLEITDNTPYVDWEQRRYEIAKAAVQGLLANPEALHHKVVERYRVAFQADVAHSAVKYADALIEELKKK